MADSLRAEIAEVRARCMHLPVVTATAIAAVLVTALRYGVFTNEVSLDVAYRFGFSARALSMGHWSTLVSSQFLTRNAFMAVSIALSLAFMLGLYEAVAGGTRALVVTLATALAGPLLVAGGLAIGASLGNTFAIRTLTTLDYGASAVTAGAGGALVAALGLRRLRWIAVFWVVAGLVLHHQLADWEHVGSFATGYGLGHVLGAAPVVGPFRRRCSWLGATTLRPAHLVAPMLVVATLVGGLAGNAAVPPRRQSSGFLAAWLGDSRPVTARVISINYPTSSLGRSQQAFVVLPAGYAGSKRHYPVVEMLHGTPGAPSDIIAGLDPVGAAMRPAIGPFIGVAPDGHGTVVHDGQFAHTSAQRLGTALSDDLRAFVDANYRTNGHWSVIGLSSGGNEAAYLGARTPGQYDAVCAMSGNFTPARPALVGQSRTALQTAAPLLHARRAGPRTLLIAGKADRRTVADAAGYARALQSAGQLHATVVVPGGHNWKLWRREFPRCLRFVLAGSPTGAPAAAGVGSGGLR